MVTQNRGLALGSQVVRAATGQASSVKAVSASLGDHQTATVDAAWPLTGVPAQ